MASLPDLFVSLKEKAGQDPSFIPAAFRQIERWVKGVSIASSSFYASLTGAGETVTPGALTQAGGMTINSGSQVISLLSNSAASAQTSGIEIRNSSTTNGINIFEYSTATIQIAVSGAGGIINIVAAGPLELGGSHLLVTAGPGSAQVNLFCNGGNPNAVVTALAKGDICFDNSTPGIWQATAPGSASWTQYTFP